MRRSLREVSEAEQRLADLHREKENVCVCVCVNECA